MIFRLSQTCNHAAALMFKVESAFRLDISDPSVTSGQCSWNAPSSKQPFFMKVEDMEFVKPSHNKRKMPGAHNNTYSTAQFWFTLI